MHSPLTCRTASGGNALFGRRLAAYAYRDPAALPRLAAEPARRGVSAAVCMHRGLSIRAQLEQLLRHVGVTVSDVELDIVVEVRQRQRQRQLAYELRF